MPRKKGGRGRGAGNKTTTARITASLQTSAADLFETAKKQYESFKQEFFLIYPLQRASQPLTPELKNSIEILEKKITSVNEKLNSIKRGTMEVTLLQIKLCIFQLHIMEVTDLKAVLNAYGEYFPKMLADIDTILKPLDDNEFENELFCFYQRYQKTLWNSHILHTEEKNQKMIGKIELLMKKTYSSFFKLEKIFKNPFFLQKVYLLKIINKKIAFTQQELDQKYKLLTKNFVPTTTIDKIYLIEIQGLILLILSLYKYQEKGFFTYSPYQGRLQCSDYKVAGLVFVRTEKEEIGAKEIEERGELLSCLEKWTKSYIAEVNSNLLKLSLNEVDIQKMREDIRLYRLIEGTLRNLDALIGFYLDILGFITDVKPELISKAILEFKTSLNQFFENQNEFLFQLKNENPEKIVTVFKDEAILSERAEIVKQEMIEDQEREEAKREVERQQQEKLKAMEKPEVVYDDSDSESESENEPTPKDIIDESFRELEETDVSAYRLSIYMIKILDKLSPILEKRCLLESAMPKRERNYVTFYLEEMVLRYDDLSEQLKKSETLAANPDIQAKLSWHPAIEWSQMELSSNREIILEKITACLNWAEVIRERNEAIRKEKERIRIERKKDGAAKFYESRNIDPDSVSQKDLLKTGNREYGKKLRLLFPGKELVPSNCSLVKKEFKNNLNSLCKYLYSVLDDNQPTLDDAICNHFTVGNVHYNRYLSCINYGDSQNALLHLRKAFDQYDKIRLLLTGQHANYRAQANFNLAIAYEALHVSFNEVKLAFVISAYEVAYENFRDINDPNQVKIIEEKLRELGQCEQKKEFRK